MLFVITDQVGTYLTRSHDSKGSWKENAKGYSYIAIHFQKYYYWL